MSQPTDDPKDPIAPKPTPAPPAAKPGNSELSDEELGKVSGGLAQVAGGRRGRTEQEPP